MNKKDLKMYDAPACEVVELKVQGILCVSGGETNAEDIIVVPPTVDPVED